MLERCLDERRASLLRFRRSSLGGLVRNSLANLRFAAIGLAGVGLAGVGLGFDGSGGIQAGSLAGFLSRDRGLSLPLSHYLGDRPS